MSTNWPDLSPGSEFTGTWTPNRTQLFRFSALTWNAHLIHLDRVSAHAYGLDDVVVHSQLHACEIVALCTRLLGRAWEVAEMEWKNRAPAYVSNDLFVRFRVLNSPAAEGHLDLGFEETTADGSTCVEGAISLRPALVNVWPAPSERSDDE